MLTYNIGKYDAGCFSNGNAKEAWDAVHRTRVRLYGEDDATAAPRHPPGPVRN